MNKERRKRIESIIDKLQKIETEIDELVNDECGQFARRSGNSLKWASSTIAAAIYHLKMRLV